MQTGIVFDIREFAVHDGPGIRTSVFLKGCPLACQWCHNPEGQARQPQEMLGPSGKRMAGKEYTAAGLATILNRQAEILKAAGGGVTFSGGEPLLQAAFVSEVIDQLEDLHVLIDTSGFGTAEAFRLLLERADLVYYDLKLVDPQAHLYYTGCDNRPILENLERLSASGVPFVIRVPLVPGVTDTEQNLRAIAATVQGLAGLVQVDLLPYNRAAGAKYPAAGMTFRPEYDENQQAAIRPDLFENLGIKVKVR